MALGTQIGGLFLWFLIASGSNTWQLCDSNSSECLHQATPACASSWTSLKFHGFRFLSLWVFQLLFLQCWCKALGRGCSLGADAGIQTITFGDSLAGVLCSLPSLALHQLLSSAVALCSLHPSSSLLLCLLPAVSLELLVTLFLLLPGSFCFCHLLFWSPVCLTLWWKVHQEWSLEKLFIRPYIDSKASRGCLPAFQVSWPCQLRGGRPETRVFAPVTSKPLIQWEDCDCNAHSKVIDSHRRLCTTQVL